MFTDLNNTIVTGQTYMIIPLMAQNLKRKDSRVNKES